MKGCPYCAHENREGVLFCEDCGENLFGSASDATLPTRQLEQAAPGMGAAGAVGGTARFSESAQIIIHVRDAADPIIFHPHAATVLGRLDTTSPKQPDLDLTPFGALEKGVSRIHAAINRSDDTLTITDMDSANGTLLNGERLIPQQPRVLRDGDELVFGKLVAHIYFKS